MKDILIVCLAFILVYVWYLFSTGKANEIQHIKNEDRTKEWVDEYLYAWKKKQPIDSLMKFYTETSLLYSLTGDSLIVKGLELIDFLPWGNSTVLQKRKAAIIISELILQPQKVMIAGKLAPLQKGALVIKEEIPFLTWIEFDSSGHILKQVWWQKYPNE